MSGPVAAVATKTAQKPTVSAAVGQQSVAEPEREPKGAARGSLAPNPAAIPADPPAKPRFEAVAPILSQPKPAVGALALVLAPRDDPSERGAEDFGRSGRAASDRARSGGKSGAGVPLGAEFSARIEAARRGGAPIPPHLRAAFEPALATDLSGVRIHEGSDAAAASRALGAKAFTSGQDIFFARGQYDPSGAAGRALLAHELAHVAQGDSRILCARDDEALRHVTIERLEADKSFIVTFAFADSAISFAAPPTGLAMRPGSYRIGASAELPRDEPEKVYFKVIGGGWAAGIFFAFTEPDIAAVMPDLLRAKRFLLDGKQVPLTLTQTSGAPGSEKEGGGKEGGGKSTGGGGELLPAEPWLATELLPALKKNLDEAHAGAGVAKLVGYRAPRVEREEGEGVAMIQLERPAQGQTPQLKAYIRARRDRWVDRSPDERAAYVVELGAQAEASMTRAATKRQWSNPDLTGSATGRGYEFPALPAEIVGLNQQPLGGTGQYLVKFDFSAAAPDLLSQASWAAQEVGCRWEVWDISAAPDVQAAEKRARRGDKGVGAQRLAERSEGFVQNIERKSADLDRRPAEIEADEQAALEQGRYADALANEINKELLGLETITSYGKELLGGAADYFGDSTERKIAWNNPGVFVVRVIAKFNPEAGPDKPKRAPSVATKVVAVKALRTVSREALDDADQQEIRANERLIAALQSKDSDAIAEATDKVAEAKVESRGETIEVLEDRLKRIEAQRAKAEANSTLLKAGLHDAEVSDLTEQKENLEKQLERARRYAVEIGSGGAPARRLHAVLVSRVTGQVYPMLLQIGEPTLVDGRWRCLLGDVTGVSTAKYEGWIRDPGEGADPELRSKAKQESCWAAIDALGGGGEYGPGSLTARLPAEGFFAKIPEQDRVRTLEFTHARDWAAAKKRLAELSEMLMALGLIAGSGGAGLAAGLIAAGLAAERIISRVNNGTFEWKSMETVSDTLDLLGPVAMGLHAIGSLQYLRLAGGGFVLKSAKLAAGVGTVLEKSSEVGGIVMCNLQTMNSMLEIGDKVRAGKLNAAEARLALAEAVVGALKGNGMALASHIGHGVAEEGHGKTAGDRESAAGRRPGEIDSAPREKPGARPAGEHETAGDAAEAQGEKPVAAEPKVAAAGEKAAPFPRAAEADAPPVAQEKAAQIKNEAFEELHAKISDLPETSVILDGANATSRASAEKIYRNCVKETPTRESAIYRNTETGVYIVVQGNEHSVFVRGEKAGSAEAPHSGGEAQYWKEILNEHGGDVGDWELMAHSHPVGPSGHTVRLRDRLPSGSAGDVGALIYESERAGGEPRTSRLDYYVDGKPQSTYFGYDPKSTTAKVWIDYVDLAGERERLPFPDLESYHNWFKDNFGFDLSVSHEEAAKGGAAPEAAPVAKVSETAVAAGEQVPSAPKPPAAPAEPKRAAAPPWDTAVAAAPEKGATDVAAAGEGAKGSAEARAPEAAPPAPDPAKLPELRSSRHERNSLLKEAIRETRNRGDAVDNADDAITDTNEKIGELEGKSDRSPPENKLLETLRKRLSNLERDYETKQRAVEEAEADEMAARERLTEVEKKITANGGALEPLDTAPPDARPPESFDWKSYFSKKTGSKPSSRTMHAHHIVYKGEFERVPEMQEALQRSREVLYKYGIDPVWDPSALMWAENEAHTVENAKSVAQKLEAADRAVQALKLTGEAATKAMKDKLAQIGKDVFGG